MSYSNITQFLVSPQSPPRIFLSCLENFNSTVSARMSHACWLAASPGMSME
ncbi:predicted protein [Botrytis cinerea T4]|uniref:Uncharacterized protein n=1 Tax=Botryotinia fuckeliana (strain T4) TaxID=999810 RepID=G2YPV2_BOTF4|nr:predicted protein [Botrytis cinerea T4]